ncbi:hypothetical protein WJ970_00605 [Achromobacter xylosoxidans]
MAKLENDASRSQAAAYAAALRDAGNGWGRTGRAQAWHQAGLMARRHGMEIMGYEEDPDYAVYDGSYTYGAGRNYFLWTQEHGNAIPATPAQRAEAALPGPYVTQQERERYAASEARPYARFHYRQIAASHMMKAVDELPARSQAYAAVLCQGTRFVINDAPDVAAKMYRRYVETGAVVPFSGSFGQECAEPDFKGAARFHYVQAWRAWERLRHDHPGRLLAAGLLALAAAAAVLRCGSGVRVAARARRADPRWRSAPGQRNTSVRVVLQGRPCLCAQLRSGKATRCNSCCQLASTRARRRRSGPIAAVSMKA